MSLLLLLGIGGILGLTRRLKPVPLGVALTELLAILLPALIFCRPRPRLLRLTPPGRRWPQALVGAMGGILLGFGCFYGLSVWIEPFFEHFLPIPAAERRQLWQLLYPATGLRPLWQDLLCFAVVPAICEEILFRGVMLSAFLTTFAVKKPQPAQQSANRIVGFFYRSEVHAVFLCALLFGIFHLSIYKLMPTLLLGLGFGAAALWGRCLSPAITMHFSNNALVLLLVRAGFDEAPDSMRTMLHAGRPGAGGLWLLAALTAVLTGYFMLRWSAKSAGAGVNHAEVASP